MDLSRILRKVSQTVALIAHRRRVSQLVHYHSDSKGLLKFGGQAQYRFTSLDGGLEPLLAPEHHHSNNVSAQVQCGLQTIQIQGHVVTDQRRTLPHCG